MTIDEIAKLDEQYYSPVFGKRLPVEFVRGEDVYLFDSTGKKYTDFLSGIATNCLGYSDNGFKQALTDVVNSLMHTTNYFYNETQAKLAEKLCAATGYDNVFLANSGAEAVEGALKLARKYHFGKGAPRAEIITMQGSFHGRTLATLAATGQAKFHEAFQPLIDRFTYVPVNDIVALEAAVSSNTAAVLIEPILGEGGIIPVTPEYFQAIRRVCDAYGALMIADEIQTGMGRTGALLASPALGAMPDVVVLAKSLGNGFPVGAFLARGEAAKAFAPGDHGSTFGGNRMACAAAHYVTCKLVDTDILSHVAEMGTYFMAQLKALQSSCPVILDVRGRGLMLGVDLAPSVSALDVKKALLEAGFVTATAGQNVLRLVPPYVIQKEHIDALVAALRELLA
jgi:acetylornithine aminotransferase/acetylornithine/N-succinyldiaminopimelate aminotransferase